MLKIVIFCVILLNGNVVYCDECSEQHAPGMREMVYGGTCCKFPDIPDDTNYDDQCYKELKLAEAKVETLAANNTVECMITECLLTKAKFYADGKVVMTEVKKVVSDLLKDSPPWIPLVNQIIEKCVKDGVSKEAEIKQKASEAPFNISKSCNSALSYMVNCLSVQLTVQCPAENQVKSDKCDKGRDLLKKCPDQYFSFLAEAI